MTGRRGPDVQTLDPSEQERLAAIRESAREQHADFLRTQSPDDTLGALAWTAGAIGAIPASPLDEHLIEVIDQARNKRFTWRQIATAMGEGSTADDARRVRDRFTAWTKD